MKLRNLLQLNCILFFIVAFLHLTRVFLGWDFILGNVALGSWASIIAAIILVWLLFHNYTHMKKQ